MKTRAWESEDAGWNTQSVLECAGERSATPPGDGGGRRGEKTLNDSGGRRAAGGDFGWSLVPLTATSRGNSARGQVQSKTGRMTLVFCCLLSVLSFQASGQSYSMDWYKIAGGGGTSTSDVYAVSGTIGQPDASGAMTGGNYTIIGGFWALPMAVQTEGAPWLAIFRTATNTVAVSWPSPSMGWNLQQNTNNLSSANWTNVTATVEDDGTTRTLIVNPPAGNRFYRLHKP